MTKKMDDMTLEQVIVYMKEYALSKKVQNMLEKINPLLAKKEGNIRVHLEALMNNIITEEEYQAIEAKMALGKLCLRIEELIPNGFATLLFYVEEENKIYHGAAPNIPLHCFDFFHEVNDKQMFHEMVCGKAVNRKDIVFSDIFTDPACIHERPLSREQGFQSVWSIPFYQGDSIIGTFAIYQPHRRRPSKKQIQLAQHEVMEYQESIFLLSNRLVAKEA